MKHLFLILAFLIAGAIPHQAQTPINDSNKLSKEQVLAHVDELKELIQEKIRFSTEDIQILIEIRPEVNYVTHLYTLAELGFSDPAYAAKYGNSLPKAAIDTLQKYKEYLTFGQGENAPYSWFFFKVAQETFSNADELKTIMDDYREEAIRMGAPAN